jgi:hypothetical protein
VRLILSPSCFLGEGPAAAGGEDQEDQREQSQEVPAASSMGRRSSRTQAEGQPGNPTASYYMTLGPRHHACLRDCEDEQDDPSQDHSLVGSRHGGES